MYITIFSSSRNRIGSELFATCCFMSFKGKTHQDLSSIVINGIHTRTPRLLLHKGQNPTAILHCCVINMLNFIFKQILL